MKIYLKCIREKKYFKTIRGANHAKWYYANGLETYI